MRAPGVLKFAVPGWQLQGIRCCQRIHISINQSVKSSSMHTTSPDQRRNGVQYTVGVSPELLIHWFKSYNTYNRAVGEYNKVFYATRANHMEHNALNLCLIYVPSTFYPNRVISNISIIKRNQAYANAIITPGPLSNRLTPQGAPRK